MGKINGSTKIKVSTEICTYARTVKYYLTTFAIIVIIVTLTRGSFDLTVTIHDCLPSKFFVLSLKFNLAVSLYFIFFLLKLNFKLSQPVLTFFILSKSLPTFFISMLCFKSSPCLTSLKS